MSRRPADGEFFDVEVATQVATVTVADSVARESVRAAGRSVHWEFGQLLGQLRGDNGVRVVVITGATDGEFWAPPLSSTENAQHSHTHRSDPGALWKTFTGILVLHQTMAEMEKPIVARVNGDAVGTGSSVLFNSDLSVAVEDASIVDHHLGMGEVPRYGATFGMVPGDGGASLVPLYLSPQKAKEYLMLATPLSARELAERGVINYAVPRQRLDEVVDGLVERLLHRSAHALAWTKRIVNRRLVDHLNLTADAAAAYEMVTYLQYELLGEDRRVILD